MAAFSGAPPLPLERAAAEKFHHPPPTAVRQIASRAGGADAGTSIPGAARPAGTWSLLLLRALAAHGAALAAAAASAEEQVASRLQAADRHPLGQHQPLEHLAAAGVHAPQLALLVLQGGVPELAVDPGDAGDE